MKNFKKVLALVLAVATLLSFATVASAADFTDASSIDHTEAVDVLSAIGVLEGYTDGSFKPTKVITRAEAAKIIAMFDNGDTDIDELYAPVDFTDVESGHWAESFISYCYHTGIIAGVGNNKYAPSDDVTGVQFLKMVLVVLGFDAKEEGLTGTGYAVRTRALARELGLLAGIGNDFDYTKGLTRENAAQIMLNALTVGTVEYGKKIIGSLAAGYIGISDSEAHVNSAKTLADAWGLDCESDVDSFGRPIWVWTMEDPKYPNKKSNQLITIGTYYAAPVATYTTAVYGCDVYDDLGVELNKTGYLPVVKSHTDGVENASVEKLTDDKSTTTGAQGQLTEIYQFTDDHGDVTYAIVHINTYLAKVTAVTAEKTDSKGHVTTAASETLEVYRRANDDNYNDSTTESYRAMTATISGNPYSKGDYLLVQGVRSVGDNQRYTLSVVNHELVEGKNVKVTSVANGKNYSTVGIDGEKTPVACKFAYAKDVAVSDVGTKKVAFFDTYGNLIGLVDPAEAAANYAVLDKLYIEYAKGDATVYASLILFDGESTKKDVTVGKIKYGTETMTAWKWIAESDEMSTNDYQFQWAGSTWYTTYFYQKVVNYVENDDGTTDFQINAAKNLATDDIKIVKGSKYITAAENGVVPVLKASENTIYMVQTSAAPNAKYASYVGYENVPSMTTTAAAQYVLASDGTVQLIYIYEPVLPSTKSYVYYNGNGYFDEYDGKYHYNVIVLDENGAVADEAGVIDSKVSNLFGAKGLYLVTKDSNGLATAADRKDKADVRLHKTALSNVYVYATEGGILTEKDGYWTVADGADASKATFVDMATVKFYNLTGVSTLTIADLDNYYCNLWYNAAGTVVAVVALGTTN